MNIKVQDYQKATEKFLIEVDLFKQKIENFKSKRDEAIIELDTLEERLHELNTDLLMTLDESEAKEIQKKLNQTNQRISELSYFKIVDLKQVVRNKLNEFTSTEKFKKVRQEAQNENDKFHHNINALIEDYQKKIEELEVLKQSHNFPIGERTLQNIRLRNRD